MQLDYSLQSIQAHTQQKPRVSIIVVNYNGTPYLDMCLGSLLGQHYEDCEILVVDNCSTDESPAFIQKHFPQVTLIRSAENLGYSGAVNLALDHAAGMYIAVLNMDAMVDPDWLEPLVAFLDEHARVGAVTPKILLLERPEYINALGQNVHITALGFNRGYNRPDQPDDTAPFSVSGLHGAAFIVRRDLLERMGGMNVACFLYHEDVDISWLVQLMGYDIYCVPRSIVRHKYVLKMDPQKLFYLERNRMAMLLANLHGSTLLLLAPFLALTEAMMTAYCLRRGPSFIRAKARAIGWLWQQRKRIRHRHAQVEAIRQRSDWEMIARLRVGYEWDQLLKLGR